MFWYRKQALVFLEIPQILFLNIYILLKYIRLTVLQVQSKVIQLYVYTYIIFEIIFHYGLLTGY